MPNKIESSSADIGPTDSRCRWWAKVIRSDSAIPKPSDMEGATDVPGNFLRKGDEELSPGDVIIHGEEVHHRHQRGWAYNLGYMGSDGETHWVQPTAEHKQALKQAGMETDLLKGSGGLAACGRLAIGLRAGLDAGVEPMATGPVELVQDTQQTSYAGDDFLASLQAPATDESRDNGLSM